MGGWQHQIRILLLAGFRHRRDFGRSRALLLTGFGETLVEDDKLFRRSEQGIGGGGETAIDRGAEEGEDELRSGWSRDKLLAGKLTELGETFLTFQYRATSASPQFRGIER